MEVRLGAELGMKSVSREGFKKMTPLENPAHLPGKIYENRQYDQMEKEMNSLRPNQTKEVYEIEGGSVNIQA